MGIAKPLLTSSYSKQYFIFILLIASSAMYCRYVKILYIMTRFFLSCLLFAVAQWSIAQTWSLNRCISHAQDNNLTIQQAHLTARNAELSHRATFYNRLPNISGQVSAGYQFGRTIDPTTNEFNNSRIGFNSYSVDAGVLVYNGGRLNASAHQAKLDWEAANLDAANVSQTAGLNIATAYLNILLAEEQLNNSRTQLNLSDQQLERTIRLIDVGQLAPNARLDLDAQRARNEQQIIEAQNAVDQSYLLLKQLLQLDPVTPLQIEKPEVNIEDAVMVRTFTLEEVYAAALQSQPNVQAADVRVQSSAIQEKIAQTGYYPSLSVFGGLNSNYSSVNPDTDNPNRDNAVRTQDDPIDVNINGSDVSVAFYSVDGVTFPTKAFGQQLEENFGQSLGINLSVPIYSRHNNRINTERARINAVSAELQSRQVKDQLKTDVQTSITSFRASRNAYQAAQRSLTATDAAFNDAQRRFDVGAINSFEFNNAVDNLDIARRELTRAKFQLLFNLKVVEFYLGQPLDL